MLDWGRWSHFSRFSTDLIYNSLANCSNYTSNLDVNILVSVD